LKVSVPVAELLMNLGLQFECANGDRVLSRGKRCMAAAQQRLEWLRAEYSVLTVLMLLLA
jgi:hypothetical protein